MGVIISKNIFYLQKKRNRIILFKTVLKINESKKHDKYCFDNILKKYKGKNYICIHFTLNTLIENHLSQHKFNKNYIKNHQLKKIKGKKYIQNSDLEFNQKFFNQTLKEIYISYEISSKYKQIDNNEEHNYNINNQIIIDRFSPQIKLFKELIEKTFEESRMVFLMTSDKFKQYYSFYNKYLFENLTIIDEKEKTMALTLLKEGLGKHCNKKYNQINKINNDTVLNNLKIENKENELNNINKENTNDDLLNNLKIENKNNVLNNLNRENYENELNNLKRKIINDEKNIITESSNYDFNIIEDCNIDFDESDIINKEINIKLNNKLPENFQNQSTKSRTFNEDDNDFNQISLKDALDKFNSENQVKFEFYMDEVIENVFFSEKLQKSNDDF